ncbi:glycosyltransferase family 4 protein [Nocardiopsis sp. TNDT3]|jgi:glycosyltransferase involved in cell wall biosynthesis|uniref:glycosyltransferase family 4 protein n=1 Tax=Nocardiopsis sp. TNDT3 TaxID=2249354 RepID=UPI000E3C8C74|nr:glycosyltransferase family 4 protein [Nocardiopsis sp. TNDT3]
MKILLIGPDHAGGSIPPYLNVLSQGLRALGAEVDRLGSAGEPFDEGACGFWSAERIVCEARGLLARVDLSDYDVVSLHFGNLEVEQLLPSLWEGLERPAVVYHVHSLDWTLFTEHVPDTGLRARVEAGVRSMDGFLYFGSYARHVLGGQGLGQVPGRVNYLPTTIPVERLSAPNSRARLGNAPVASLYGYPSTWKDAEGLLQAFRLMRHPMRFVLAGPRWDNPTQSGVDLMAGTSVHGPVQVEVRPHYMGVEERVALMAESDLAIFPYQDVPTFQGSGAIADYLVHGIPVLATDVANMAEVIGEAGTIIPPGEPRALAGALDRFASEHSHRRDLAEKAERRSELFHPTRHARICLDFFAEVVKTRG